MSRTTLTAPSDKKEKLNIEFNASSLTNEEMKVANSELNINTNLESYRKVQRKYCDPAIEGQKYSLFSFIPSSGATPDKDGIYGMALSRGNYNNLEESDQRVKYLIQEVDSHHKIYTCYTGKPFPITLESKFSQEQTEVNIKKGEDVLHKDLNKNKKKQEDEIKDIKEREQKLLEETRQENVDPHEKYTTLRVKKAQLVFTYYETEKKLEEMKNIIKKTIKEIDEMDSEDPEYIKKYMERYMNARNKVGLKDDAGFIQYLGDDIKLDFLEEDKKKSY